MKLSMHFAEFIVSDMCIYLRGGDICVSEKRLYRAQISTILKKVGCKTVSKDMRSDLL